MTPVALGFGLAMSLAFSEAFGLAAGGMIAPGYMALVLAEPWRAVVTIAVAVATFLIVRLVSRCMLLYGRRHLVMALLIGSLCVHLARVVLGRPEAPEFLSVEAIGYVVPGMIAYWMERQGALATLTSMLMAAALVRLVLIVVSGGAPIEVPAW